MKKYAVTLSPHLRSEDSIVKRMWKSTAALSLTFLIVLIRQPLEILSVFGLILSAAFLSEIAEVFLFRKKMKLQNGRTFLMALLLTLLIPSGLPFWAVFASGMVAFFLGNVFYGGMGNSWIHPALLGYAFLTASFPEFIRVLGGWFMSFQQPFTDVWTFLAALFLLGGGIVLMFQRIIFWEIPVFYLGVIFLPTWLMNIHTRFSWSLVFLNAFWFLSDPLTTPTTRRANQFFAITAAFLTLSLDLLSVPAAPAFAVLALNLLTPWLDEWMVPRGVAFKMGNQDSL